MAKTGSLDKRIFNSVAVIVTGRNAWDTESLEAFDKGFNDTIK
jgi:hypothetical protein